MSLVVLKECVCRTGIHLSLYTVSFLSVCMNCEEGNFSPQIKEGELRRDWTLTNLGILYRLYCIPVRVRNGTSLDL